MESIQLYTTLWRVTCGLPKYGVDYQDYLRGTNKDVDIILMKGNDICKKVEYVSIRQHKCWRCTAPFYQTNTYHFHINSKSTTCEFQGSVGATSPEDNFGCYFNYNSVFRCTLNQQSTTEVWFGDYF